MCITTDSVLSGWPPPLAACEFNARGTSPAAESRIASTTPRWIFKVEPRVAVERDSAAERFTAKHRRATTAATRTLSAPRRPASTSVRKLMRAAPDPSENRAMLAREWKVRKVMPAPARAHRAADTPANLSAPANAFPCGGKAKSASTSDPREQAAAILNINFAVGKPHTTAEPVWDSAPASVAACG